jgi:hypothetical protein
MVQGRHGRLVPVTTGNWVVQKEDADHQEVVDLVALKACTGCGEEKDTADFNRTKRTKDGLHSQCKSCTTEKYRAYCKEQRESNPIDWKRRQMLADAKKRAKKFNLPCDLTLDDIGYTTHCPVLGVHLSWENVGQALPTSPSLDRLIPELGYVKGNVAVISVRANAIKNDATWEEVQKVANWLRPKGS